MPQRARQTAVIVAIALVGAASIGAFDDASANNGTSDQHVAQDFRRSTNGAATAFAASVRKLADKVGLNSADGMITTSEVGPANAVSSYPSNDTKLGAWALSLHAKGHDDNPRIFPIGVAIALLLIAAGLAFIPILCTRPGPCPHPR